MAVAAATQTLSSIVTVTAAPVFRRRLPLVGAFCMLSFGFAHFCPSHSFSEFGRSQSRSQSQSPIRSKFSSSQTATNRVDRVKMEAISKTVPSIVVYVTVPNKDAGKKLAESIVKEKLAACVNRVPGIESVYEWKGEIQTDNEELLIIKTRESLLDALTEHVKANHEYDVPEVIAMPIIGGSVPYLEWIKNSTRE